MLVMGVLRMREFTAGLADGKRFGKFGEHGFSALIAAT